VTFEWDPAKSAETYWRRGFDFGVAAKIFDGPITTKVDARRDYGEVRMLAVGVAFGRLITVVFTDRRRPDGSISRRIISARRSNPKERRFYAKKHQTSDAPDPWPR
jgi:uncharacterized DUF497 family protein